MTTKRILTPQAVDHFQYLARHAPTEAARRTWARLAAGEILRPRTGS